MKKFLLGLLVAVSLIVSAVPALAVITVPDGGTGLTSTPKGYVLVGSSTGKFGYKLLTAGTNITITSNTNSITINSTATGGGGGTGGVTTSTINYFAVYLTATTTTGTPLAQITAGTLTFSSTTVHTNISATSVTTTNLFYSLLQGTNAILGNVTSSNLNISGLSNLANTTITNVTSTNLNVSGLTVLGNTTIPTGKSLTFSGTANIFSADASALFYSDSLLYGFANEGAGVFGKLNTSLLTGSDKTFSFPNNTGTFALVGDNLSSFVNDSGFITSISINGAPSTTFNFATSSDTNIGIAITTSTNAITFNPYWKSTLADNRITSAAIWNAKIGSYGWNLATSSADTGFNIASSTAAIFQGSNAVTTTRSTNVLTIGLINSGITAGTYGSASAVPVLTINAQGIITSNSTSSIAIDTAAITSGILPIIRGGTNSSTIGPAGSVAYSNGTSYLFVPAGTTNQVLVSNGSAAPAFVNTNTLSLYTGWTIASSSGDSGTNVASSTKVIVTGATIVTTSRSGTTLTIGVTASGITAGTYGSASAVPVFTVDQFGRITANSTSSIAISAAAITSGVLAIAQGGTNSSTVGSAGSISWMDGTRYQASAVGTATQILTSGGTTAPLFINSTSLPYLLITGGTMTGGITFTTLNGTSITSTNAFFTNVSSTSATSTNLYVSGQATFGVGTTSWQWFTNGHVNATGTTPVVSSCGTSPSVIGNDGAGHIQVGSVAATACTLTFAAAYINIPTCLISNRNMSVVNAMTYTVNTTTIVVSQTGLTSAILDYVCFAHE